MSRSFNLLTNSDSTVAMFIYLSLDHLAITYQSKTKIIFKVAGAVFAEGGGEAAVWRVGSRLVTALREARGGEAAHRAALWRCAALLVHARQYPPHAPQARHLLHAVGKLTSPN